jgi:hypothetical protein
MGGDYGSGLSDDAAILIELVSKRPDCDIAQDSETGAWGATIWFSETGSRYIVGPSLPDLQQKLVMKLDVEGRQAG